MPVNERWSLFSWLWIWDKGDLSDEIRADERLMQLHADFHAGFERGGRSIGCLMPEFGPSRVNEASDWTAILCQDDLPTGMIDLLNDAGHGGAHRAIGVRAGRAHGDDEGQQQQKTSVYFHGCSWFGLEKTQMAT